MASPVVAAAPSASGITVALHPLALLHMVDHATRAHANAGASALLSPVGALLGTQTGLELHARHAFAVPCTAAPDGTTALDMAFFVRKLKQVLPEMEVLGWYMALPDATPPSASTLAMHRAVLEHHDSAIFVQANLSALQAPGTSLGESVPLDAPAPLVVYDTLVDPAHAGRVWLARITHWSIDTSEVERIAVGDAVADSVRAAEVAASTSSVAAPITTRTKTRKSKASETAAMAGTTATTPARAVDPVAPWLVNRQAALSIMRGHARVLCEYLGKVNRGELPLDRDLVRRIASMVALLPRSNNNDNADVRALDPRTQALDAASVRAMLTTLLATLTKNAAHTTELSDVFQKAYLRPSDHGVDPRLRMMVPGDEDASMPFDSPLDELAMEVDED